MRMRRELGIVDGGSQAKIYVKEQLSLAWKALRKVQRKSKNRREIHLEELAEHFASRRQSTKKIEINQIKRLKK